ncbi:MAG TPA: hypothetical protein VFU31_08615 [Candidatus Binatia bacterium]|nr:hypothetical protein [Candidatus Binatia bacterium]
MKEFSASFLLFAYQIALGGLFALAATPFHQLERGFYKSTAGVLFAIGILGFWGKLNLYGDSLFETVPRFAEALFHVVFIVSLGCYLISLWSEKQKFRARSFSCSLLSGLAGLVLSAHSFYDAPSWSVETFVYPVTFILSALLLGTVTVGMLIGHWYLIDSGQSLDPFFRIYKFFVIALAAEGGFLVFYSVVFYFFGAPATILELQRLWLAHPTLLASRVIVGQIAPIVLSWMIWRTLQIPHTMAATGLFYIALLGVFVGEILGRQLLALTSLPF